MGLPPASAAAAAAAANQRNVPSHAWGNGSELIPGILEEEASAHSHSPQASAHHSTLAVPSPESPQIPQQHSSRIGSLAKAFSGFSVTSSAMSQMDSTANNGQRPSSTIFLRSKSLLRGRPRNQTNFIGRLEESSKFQNATLVVITINTIWICFETQYNHKSLAAADGTLPLEPYSKIIEHFFAAFFTVEVLVRFFALRKKINFFWDRWLMFDAFLVLLMVFETWIMPFLTIFLEDSSHTKTSAFSSMRLLRLLRLTRMARLMRFFPELMTLVKGMISATQAVGFILVFLVLVTYIFAILFTLQLGSPYTVPSDEGADPTAAEMFADLGSSMMTLFTNGMLGDNLYQTLMIIKVDSSILMWTFVLYFFISSMTLLNMLIGVLCAVIEETAREEEEARTLWEMRRTIKEAFDAVDSSQDGTINPEEWSRMRSDVTVRRMFEGLGVDPEHLDDRLDQLQETLFTQDRLGSLPDSDSDGSRTSLESVGMDFEEFMEKVVDLKWDQSASALDLELLKSQVTASDKELRKRLVRIERALEHVMDEEDDRESLSSNRTPRSGACGHFENKESMLSRCSTSAGGKDSDWIKQVPTELLFYVLKMRSYHQE